MAANLFQRKQGKRYFDTRPNYPPEIFRFIASKTTCHDLVWDVGTGSGQAAQSLAQIYKQVVATDVSEEQLKYAPRLPNIRYHHTVPTLPTSDLLRVVAPESSLDLITVAQALHWFDLPSFYEQAKLLLKKPNGVLAAWCYTVAEVNADVNKVFHEFNYVDCAPYADPGRNLVREKYRGIEFPFEELEGVAEGTGPVEFRAERVMDLDRFFDYVRSMSVYGTAKERGVELLTKEVVETFERAWRADGKEEKVVSFPVYLRIGRVGK